MLLCDYLSRIAVDKGDPSEVIPISFNALAQYRLPLDHITECFMIKHSMVAIQSGTSAAGINLPPVHGAQKAIDPKLNTPMHSQTPTMTITPSLTPGTQQTSHQQIPTRSQPISKIPINPAQAVSRKLIQRSVKLLNAPKHKISFRQCPGVTPNVKLFPSTDTSIHPGNESLELCQSRIPIAPMSKLALNKPYYLKKILLILIQS